MGVLVVDEGGGCEAVAALLKHRDTESIQYQRKSYVV
jgi:hypothetical protein